MKYILDFDRTIFDTERLYEELSKVGARDIAGTVDSLDLLDVPSLVFADAQRFLITHNKNNIVVLSSCTGEIDTWDHEYQLEKIYRSGIKDLVSNIVVVTSEKSQLLVKYKGDEECVFVDDIMGHLLAVKKVVPEVICVLMDRDNMNGLDQTDFLNISSLDDLDVNIGE
jgi:hypothetical protein